MDGVVVLVVKAVPVATVVVVVVVVVAAVGAKVVVVVPDVPPKVVTVVPDVGVPDVGPLPGEAPTPFGAVVEGGSPVEPPATSPGTVVVVSEAGTLVDG